MAGLGVVPGLARHRGLPDHVRAHRPRRDGGVPPPSHPSRVQDHPRAACDARRARLGGHRGAGHLVGGRPPPPPRLLRPAGRPAQPPRGPWRRLERRAARAAARPHGLAVHPHRSRQPPAVRARPPRRPDRPHRRSHVHPLGARRAGGLVRSRRRDRRHGGRGPDRSALGRRGPHPRPAPRHVLDQLALPLLRAQALRQRRRVAQPRVAGFANLRGVVAQQPSRLPDVGRPRDAALGDRSVGDVHLGSREARAGLGRRAGPPGAPDQQARRLLSTAPLRSVLAEALPERPFRLELWDGTALASTTGGPGPTFSLRSPRALGHMLRAPGQLGLGRAYVAGDLEVDDVEAPRDLLDPGAAPPLDPRAKTGIVRGALRAGAWRPLPRAPAAELPPRGRRPGIARDRRSVRHHYDVSNEFFALFLGEHMTYSCAIWSRGATTLDEAQETKLELVCTKLGLREGERLLDVGCGWGSFAVHAATRHGVHVTGITLSEPQAAGARARAEAAGVADRVDIRVADYRELEAEPFDAIASIGMVEHVGVAQIDTYARRLAALLRPGGRLLNHGIARLRHGDPEAGPFSERFVFPDAAPLHLSRVQFALEAAGFATDHVEGFAPDYAQTLREWTRRLEERRDEAIALAGPERVRVWRVYLRAARRGFESGFTSIYQVRALRPGAAPGQAVAASGEETRDLTAAR